MIIGSDDAAFTKWKSNMLYPVVTFFLNIPPCYWNKFPLLHCFYCGPTCNKAPEELFHASALKMINEYNRNPLEWPDGTKKKLRIINNSGDALEKAKVLRQVPHHGKHSCFFCLVRGEAEPGSTKLKYGQLFHQQPSELRSEKQRLEYAEKFKQLMDLWEEGLLSGREPDPVFGVKGIPFYTNLMYFDGLWSFVIDLLHTLYEGVGKRLVSILIEKSDIRSLLHNKTIVGELSRSTVAYQSIFLYFGSGLKRIR